MTLEEIVATAVGMYIRTEMRRKVRTLAEVDRKVSQVDNDVHAIYGMLDEHGRQLGVIGARVLRVASRLDQIESDLQGHTAIITDLSRRVVRLELGLDLLLGHFGLPKPTEDEVTEILDAE